MHLLTRTSLTGLLAILALGCESVGDADVDVDTDVDTDSDSDTDSDTSQDWDGEVEPPAAPALPAAPAAVRLTQWTCPAGWLPVTHPTLGDPGGRLLSWCEPPPLPRLRAGEYLTPLAEGEAEGERPICDPALDGSFPLLGKTDCQPLGDACPTGRWPEIPAEISGARIYVDGEAGPLGDGSQAAPFDDIGTAVASASSGDVVVIGPGIYAESVVVDRDLTLWGSCVQQSAVEAPGPLRDNQQGAIMVTSDVAVSLRNLRISGDQNAVAVWSPGAVVDVQGLWIHQSTRWGLLAGQGLVRASGVLVDSTRPDTEGKKGKGVQSLSGGRVEVAASTIENNGSYGAVAFGQDAVVELSDVAVRQTQGDGNQKFGRGMGAEEGAQSKATQCLFESNREVGVAVLDPGSIVALEDVHIRDTRGRALDGDFGMGLFVSLGGAANTRRTVLQGNRRDGFYVVNPGSNLQAEDVVVRDPLVPAGEAALVAGIQVNDGAEVGVTRGLFERGYQAGVAVFGEGTSVELEDVVVRETAASSVTEEFGHGVRISEGARLTGVRLLLEANRTSAIAVLGLGTVAELEDVTVRDTQSQLSDGEFGRGLYANEGAEVTVLRSLFERNRDVAVAVLEPDTRVILEDVTVRGTRPRESDDSFGWGMGVQQGAELVVTRALLEENHGLGFAALDDGTELLLEDVTVIGTQSEVSSGFFGRGVGMARGARATLKRGLFKGHYDTGISLQDAGTDALLEDIGILRNKGYPLSGLFGRGVDVFRGASCTVRRGLIEANRTDGIVAFDPGTRLTLEEVAVVDTRVQACSELPEDDPDYCYPVGNGLGVYIDAEASVSGLVVGSSSLAGVQIARGGTVRGERLNVVNNPIGVNVQEPPAGYDFFDAIDELLMEGNRVNFDSQVLHVPDPARSLEP